VALYGNNGTGMMTQINTLPLAGRDTATVHFVIGHAT
jgi:hypothetical protein